VKYSIDPPKKPLGTGGPVKNAEKLVGHSETFLVLNGDVFADLSYTEILEAHTKNKALATIALFEVEDPTRYGVAELAENCRIKKFIEKPAKGTAPTNLINAGIYVLNPKILLNTLAKTPKIKSADKFELKKPTAIDKGVNIGAKSVIGPYAILGKNVRVGKNVQIKESVILSDAKIGDSSLINGAIIGEGVIIGKKVKVSKGCVIGDKAKIRDNLSLEKEATVCPAQEVLENILKSKIIC